MVVRRTFSFSAWRFDKSRFLSSVESDSILVRRMLKKSYICSSPLICMQMQFGSRIGAASKRAAAAAISSSSSFFFCSSKSLAASCSAKILAYSCSSKSLAASFCSSKSLAASILSASSYFSFNAQAAKCWSSSPSVPDFLSSSCR